jgi:hypothetical protein
MCVETAKASRQKKYVLNASLQTCLLAGKV